MNKPCSHVITLSKICRSFYSGQLCQNIGREGMIRTIDESADRFVVTGTLDRRYSTVVVRQILRESGLIPLIERFCLQLIDHLCSNCCQIGIVCIQFFNIAFLTVQIGLCVKTDGCR